MDALPSGLILMLAPLAAVDLAGLIKGLIYLLIGAMVIGVVCYIIVRLASQFMPGFAPFAWIIYCVGGLILLLIALQVFGPMMGL